MATVKASCPKCGNVETTTLQLKLLMDQADATAGQYSFFCPSCSKCVTKPAEAEIFEKLAEAGVKRFVLPLELTESIRQAPRIGFADFAINLQNALDELAGADMFSAAAKAELGLA